MSARDTDDPGFDEVVPDRSCRCGREPEGAGRQPCPWADVTSVPVELLRAQADTGWPDIHPEHFCLRCGNRNLRSWFVDSTLWNTAFALAEPGVQSILDPQCFTELYAKATGQTATWQLVSERMRPSPW